MLITRRSNLLYQYAYTVSCKSFNNWRNITLYQIYFIWPQQFPHWILISANQLSILVNLTLPAVLLSAQHVCVCCLQVIYFTNINDNRTSYLLGWGEIQQPNAVSSVNRRNVPTLPLTTQLYNMHNCDSPRICWRHMAQYGCQTLWRRQQWALKAQSCFPFS